MGGTYHLNQRAHGACTHHSDIIVQQIDTVWHKPVKLGLVREVRGKCKEHIQTADLRTGSIAVPNVGTDERKYD